MLVWGSVSLKVKSIRVWGSVSLKVKSIRLGGAKAQDLQLTEFGAEGLGVGAWGYYPDLTSRGFG